jgi:hypothetical protein
MGKKEVSARHNLDRRDFLSGIGGIATVAGATTPSLAGITQVGAGENPPQTTTAATSLSNGRLQDKVAVVTGAARRIGRDGRRLGGDRGNCLTRLNTLPVRSLANASTPPSRAAPHDSGPMWVATSHLYDSFIHYTSPV